MGGLSTGKHLRVRLPYRMVFVRLYGFPTSVTGVEHGCE